MILYILTHLLHKGTQLFELRCQLERGKINLWVYTIFYLINLVFYFLKLLYFYGLNLALKLLNWFILFLNLLTQFINCLSKDPDVFMQVLILSLLEFLFHPILYRYLQKLLFVASLLTKNLRFALNVRHRRRSFYQNSNFLFFEKILQACKKQFFKPRQ